MRIRNAGRILLDKTMREVEVVDSGPVRIGHGRSSSTFLDMRRGEVPVVRIDRERH